MKSYSKGKPENMHGRTMGAKGCPPKFGVIGGGVSQGKKMPVKKTKKSY